MSDQVKEFIATLPEQQAKHYETVKWLVNDGPRGSGRTFLLALAFVEKAITCGHPVNIWDHTHYNDPRMLSYLLDIIVGIVDKLENYKLIVRQQSRTIQITWNYDKWESPKRK